MQMMSFRLVATLDYWGLKMFDQENNINHKKDKSNSDFWDGAKWLFIVLFVNLVVNICFYAALFISIKNETITNKGFNFAQFMSQYYMTQSNWLNFWLFCLTIILAVIGIISAIDYRSKKEEMDKVIQDSTAKILINEAKMNEMDKFISDSRITIDENVFKMREYLNQVDKFAQEAKESERLSEAYSWFSKGNKAYNDKKYEEAIEYYSKAIEINENFTEAYFSKCAAYINLQKFYNAIEDYKKILELNPNYTDAYYSLIQAYIEVDDVDKAWETLNEFIKKEPNPYIYMDDYTILLEALDKSKNKELAQQIISFIDKNWRKIESTEH